MNAKKFVGLMAGIMMMSSTPFAQAQTQDLQLDGDHGKLAATLQTPEGKEKYPLVMILHGFTANKEMDLLKDLADDLEAKGIASIRFDFNGHGHSEGQFQDMTVLNEIEDAKKVYAYVANLPEVKSVSLVGHSQGGVVASMTAGELGDKKVKSLALMAPAAVLRENTMMGYLFGKNFDALNPPEYVEIFDGNKVGRNYILTSQKLPIYETSARYHGPAYILHGTGDTIVPYTYSERYHKIYSGSELKLLPGADHSFELNTKQAAQLVADFFARKVK